MRTCDYCGASIEHRPPSATMCGRKCSKAKWRENNKEKQRALSSAWNKANKDRMAAASRAYYARNTELCNERHRDWCSRNRKHLGKYNAHRWAEKCSPESARIADIFMRMTVSQKGRFADWLLRKSHRALSVFKVDDLVSTYNTEGI